MKFNWQHTIEGCKKGDLRSQELMYRTCYPDMIKVCLRYSYGDLNQAGGFFNTAMLKVFKNLDQFKNEGEFMAWVRRIVVNVCIDHCRLKSRFRAADISESPDYVLPVLPEIYNKLTGNDIMKLVNQLPRNTGLVFNLFVLEGYKHEEIAGLLGISSGTSKWHLNEARRLLKEKIENLFKRENIANAI